jgi:hypothetical protein
MRAVPLPRRQRLWLIRMRAPPTMQIIRNNYKKIFNQIFHPKRKDFINSLYDLLRIQDVGSFKLLRELFRIARIHYVPLRLSKMPEIYQQIADKDTF